MMAIKLSWRPPAGSARALIAAAGLAVIALLIATYGNAREVSDSDGPQPAGATSGTQSPQ